MPKPNLLDKVVSYVSPQRGISRMKARVAMALAGSYKGAREDRKNKQWSPGGGDADADILTDLPELRERSRDLVRNSPLAAGAINTKVTNIVGRGLRLESAIDHEYLKMTDEEAHQWESNTEREFKLWANSKDCDITRTNNFYEMQDLIYRSTLESGDCFALMPMIKLPSNPYSLKIQIVEADNVSNDENAGDSPTLAGGIETDKYGAPINYHVSDSHPGNEVGGDKTWTKVPAFGEQTGRRNVIHLYEKLRPGQSRGVPDLAGVIEPLKQLDRYTDAEINAAVISGMFAVFITTPTGDGLLANTTNSGGKSDDIKIGAGEWSMVDLTPGEEVNTTQSPGRPNTAFDPFVQAVLRQVGVALQLPFEILIGHFTSSYSAAQAAILAAWKFYLSSRDWLANSFCQIVYENWMDEAVLLGRVEAPGYFEDPAIRQAYLGAEWIGPPRDHIDPLKQNRADELAEDRGWKTTSQNTSERGGDWDKKHKQRAKEVRMRTEDGLIEPVNQGLVAEQEETENVEDQKEE